MIESCSPSLEIVRRERGAVDSGSLDVRELEGGGGGGSPGLWET